MAIVEMSVESRVGNLDEAWARLGNTGIVRREMGDLLDEGARVGAQSIEFYAPEGASHGLKRAVSSQAASLQADGGLEARAGVGEVRGLPGDRLGPTKENYAAYPYYVHEGTGIYGIFHRPIRPVRSRFMRFVGRTGLVFARTVRGQRPQPYVAEAFADVIVFVEQRIDRMVHRILGS